MNLSRFKFQAFTNTGFEPVLKKELSHLVSNPIIKNIFGKTGVEFRGTFAEMINIIIYSRTINSLRIVLSHPFHASDQGNIKYNLEKLNYLAFLPQKAVLNDYVKYHTNSISSQIYHESMLKEIVKAKIEEMMSQHLQLQDLSKVLDKELSQVVSAIQSTEDEQIITQEEPEIETAQPVKHQKKRYSINKKKFEDEIFHLYFNLYKDKMCVSLEVFNTQLFKTGYKKFLGWGSVKENIISAYLQQTGIIDEFKKEQSIKVFDPFCGSGTILIESILSTINYPIRYENIDQMNFNNWPIVEKDSELRNSMKEYTDQKKVDYDKEIKVSCIGCDVSINQLNNAFKNFKHLEDLDIVKNLRLNDNKIIISIKNALSEQNKTVRSFKNKILLIHSNFKDMKEQMDKLEGYTLISNIPFGLNYSEEKLNSLYQDFDEFLAENHKLFKKIVILCPNNRNKSFIVKSKYQWNLELDFYNGGYKMGFFSFSPEKNTISEQKDEIVVHTRILKRSRRSPITVVSNVNMNKLKTPNSRKAKEIVDFAKKTTHNTFLKNQKEYEDKKSQRINDKISLADQRKALMMEQKLKELIGEKAADSITKLIKSE